MQNGGASCAAALATLVTDVIQTQARGVIRADNQDEKRLYRYAIAWQVLEEEQSSKTQKPMVYL